MSKKKAGILEEITPHDALTILKILSGEDENLKAKIEQIAQEYLKKIDLDEIASEVYFALDILDVEEVWDQSGSTRNGYVDPTDAAWEMFEEALSLFIAEIKRLQKLSMDKEAKIYCMGVLKGIYQFEKESTSEFKDWAVDAPKNFFESVFDEWEKGQKDKNDIAEVKELIRKNFSDWK